jgi:hypothetical protein
MATKRPEKVGRVRAPSDAGPAPRWKRDWIPDAVAAFGFAVASGLVLLSATVH